MNRMSEICSLAVETYGTNNQILQAIEECAELQTALLHRMRNRVGTYPVIDEIADVTIMLHQLGIIYGQDAIDIVIQEKLSRLKRRIEEVTGAAL